MNEEEQNKIGTRRTLRNNRRGNLSKEGIRLSEEKNVVITKMEEEKDVKEWRRSSGELEENNLQ